MSDASYPHSYILLTCPYDCSFHSLANMQIGSQSSSNCFCWHQDKYTIQHSFHLIVLCLKPSACFLIYYHLSNYIPTLAIAPGGWLFCLSFFLCPESHFFAHISLLHFSCLLVCLLNKTCPSLEDSRCVLCILSSWFLNIFPGTGSRWAVHTVCWMTEWRLTPWVSQVLQGAVDTPL